MAAVIRVSLSASIELRHGHSISRLSTVGYLPLTPDSLPEYESVERLKEAIDSQIEAWMLQAKEAEKDYDALRQHAAPAPTAKPGPPSLKPKPKPMLGPPKPAIPSLRPAIKPLIRK